MIVFTSVNQPELVARLKHGDIGIVRTDTLYGIVASAHNESAVQRVYEVKGRDDTKPPIVLISSIDQLFDQIPAHAGPYVKSVWPGPVSVILPSPSAPAWLRRGGATVAYRLPDSESLRALLDITGPLIAPSANPQGKPPAMSIDEAVEYFDEAIDFYVDGGRVIDSTPSQLIRVDQDGNTERLR